MTQESQNLLAALQLGTMKPMNTATTIALDTLSVADKLVLMERLWEDLSRRPADLSSPDWHGDLLADRMAAVREGKTSFVAWNDAKKRLQERLQ